MRRLANLPALALSRVLLWTAFGVTLVGTITTAALFAAGKYLEPKQ